MAIVLGDIIAAADGTDRKVTYNLRDWRVRVRVIDQVPPNAPVNGVRNLEPARMGLIVSVALLDATGAVAKNDRGQDRIFSASTLALQEENLGNPTYSVEAAILAKIEERIKEAEAQIAGKTAFAVAITPWLAPPAA